MKPSALILAVSGLFLASATATAEPMPERLKQHIDDHLIGVWETTTTYKGKETKSISAWRWSKGKTAIIEETMHLDDGFTGTQMGGWDPTTKSLVFQHFSSRGDFDRASYGKLNQDTWGGEGSGVWDGEPWSSELTIEWSEDGYRYSDTTQGEAFVVVAKRITSVKPSKEAHAELDYYVGDWTVAAKGMEDEYYGTWSAEWASDRSCLISRYTVHTPDGDRSGIKITAWDSTTGGTIDLDAGTNGAHELARYGKTNAGVSIGSGEGATEDGVAQARDFKVKQESDSFTWTLTNWKIGGEEQPDLVYVFQRLE